MSEDYEEFFIDPEDKEFQETIKNARKKLETSMTPVISCKTSNVNMGRPVTKPMIKSKLACSLEVSESTKLRMDESLPNHHEDHIAGKGDSSLQHYNLVHKLIPLSQVMKIFAAKAAVDKEWENWKRFRNGTWRKSEDEVRTKDAKVHFVSLMDLCHLKNAELEAKHQKYKERVVLRGDIVKDDSDSYAVFTEQR